MSYKDIEMSINIGQDMEYLWSLEIHFTTLAILTQEASESSQRNNNSTIEISCIQIFLILQKVLDWKYRTFFY